MNSIAQTNQSEKQLSEKMQSFLSRYHVGRLLRSANAYKLQGFPVLSLFLVAFSTAFTQRSFFMQMNLQSGAIPFAKDTFYRFMNSCHIHWRRFTTMLAATIIESTLEPLTSADRINVLILDDSIYHRARSKKVELLARLYDHAKKEFSYGFRMLTLCWSDGNTLLPVSHTLLSTENPSYEVVAMAKKTEKIHYLHEGVMQDVKAIYKGHRKRRGRSKYLLSVEAAVCKGDEYLPVRLVFVRNRNNRKDWLVLVTTDLSLTEEEVIRIYGKRWGIDVFFKACKSYLRLEKDCRALSYDAMTAHVSVVFARYMFLAVEQRESKDDRSLGELFYLSVDELPDVCIAQALRLLVSLFAKRLQEHSMCDEAEIQEQLELFLSELPSLLSQKLRKCA